MREIVASSHRMTKLEWASTLEEFDGRCAYCGEVSTASNRGIVGDHLIPVTEFGELVVGNTVPACQTCNDSRGNKDWRTFIKSRHSSDGASRIAKIEGHIGKYNYTPCSIDDSLTLQEQEEYREILEQWERLLERARVLKLKVNSRKAMKVTGS